MYSLLVFNQPAEWIEIGRDRFLEGTDEALATSLRSLSKDAIEFLKSVPCLLMEEGKGQESVHLAEITAIGATKTVIKVGLSLSRRLTIFNADVWKMRADLGIEPFEFNRNHWAVKQADLFSGLAKAGLPASPDFVQRFAPKRPPGPTRAALLAAKSALALKSHTDLDDFLIEVGIVDLAAGRDLGSRRDRANAIVQYALANPSAVTAENRLLSTFIVETDEGRSLVSSNESAPVPMPAGSRIGSRAIPNRVFVVHGRNESVRDEVVEFLNGLGVEAIVLHEQPNMGRHLLTKFIDEAELVTFAVVLMTDDDLGNAKGSAPAPRARQNVILELGYFLSRLGQSRVCALKTPGLETPSDFDGIVYIGMDEHGRWEAELQRELVAAGMVLTTV